MSKTSKIQCTECNALNCMHAEDVLKYIYILVVLAFYTGLWMFK